MARDVRMSKPVAISRSQASDSAIVKAGQLVADGGVTSTTTRPGWELCRVAGSTGRAYPVRIELHPGGWWGSCGHYAICGVPQRHDEGACAHILAAAFAVATRRGLDIPDPSVPQPEAAAAATPPAPAAATRSRSAVPRAAEVTPPSNPVDLAAWRAKRHAEMGDDFYAS